MAEIGVPGGVVDVVSSGSGPDLVLLHSLLIDRSAYDLVAPALARARRVHRVALPGFDRSSACGPTVEDYADRVAAALRALPLRPGAALLGNGFGGFVATALAARHGTLVERLVLVDTAAGFPDAGRAAFRVMAEKVGRDGMAAIADIAARRIFHEAYLAAHPEAVAERGAVLARLDPSAFVTACRALEQVDLTPLLAGIAHPALVIVGELDAATPVELARRLAQGLKAAHFVLLPACGHCPPLEQPEIFLATVAEFLSLELGTRREGQRERRRQRR
ncbi:MAG TPA: alpha/beta fold hydrolase [Alphaproteobacteria bacterium]|nr:alpha/beta fold hydrolase [Alphaproteobacteria bacterium]